MIEIKINTPVRINRQQYDKFMGTIDRPGDFGMVLFGRIDRRGQCFVKCWNKAGKKSLEKALNK